MEALPERADVPPHHSVDARLTLAQVEAALAGCEPRCLLVTPVVARRVVRRVYDLDRGLDAPHTSSIAVSRDDLARVVTSGELGHRIDDLPDMVLLVERPTRAYLRRTNAAEVLRQCWAALFHAAVHAALTAAEGAGRLKLADARGRIDRVGQATFDEVRWVLSHEDLLLPPLDDLHVWCEFAAVFLELDAFHPHLVSAWFPSLDAERARSIVGLDVDASALLEATRPAGVVLPYVEPVAPPRARALAQRARSADGGARSERQAERGNVVRAAILATRGGADDLARRHLQALGARLTEAVGGTAWAEVLEPLLPRASRGVRAREARLLYDLQKACVDHEQEIYVIDAVEWARTLGRTPIRRALPRQREVRICRNLRKARGRVAGCEVTNHERVALAHAIGAASGRAEASVRDSFRPLLGEMVVASGLVPKTLPERVAADKLVEELLDEIVDRGNLSFGRLRDAFSRNQLKLHDLAGVGEIVRDPLLKADHKLGRTLDGVHRSAEVYLRVLQRFTAVLFGTVPGRVLFQYVALPFGGSFVILEGLNHTLSLLIDAIWHVHPHWLNPWSFIALSAFLFAVLHFPAFRRGLLAFFGASWVLARVFAIDVPRLAMRLPVIRGLRAAIFSVARVVLRTWPGRVIEEVAERGVRGWRGLRDHFVPGLVRFVVDGFRGGLELIERGLYVVDEWLRFRRGENPLWTLGKGVLGVFWTAITYVVRFSVNLLIEPQFNPLKHFPVVTVSHKLLLPTIPAVARVLATPLAGLGTAWVNTIAGALVTSTPGVFGFIAWELKENWALYASNRPLLLRPARIGSHGETMVRFLRPGFHSGTLPKLYRRLRRARQQGRHRRVRGLVDKIHHVEHDVSAFVDRELVLLLRASPRWEARPLAIGHVHAGSNRVRVELTSTGAPAVLTFELQSGWLVAGVMTEGFVANLPDGPRAALRDALIGLYKRAGVDFVREELRRLAGSRRYDVADRGLVVWSEGYDEEKVHPLPGHLLAFHRLPVTWEAWVGVWEGSGEPLLESVPVLPGPGDGG